MSEKIKVGNAEIEKANYDYFSLLYSKLSKECVIADLVSNCEEYNDLYKFYEKMQIELQQKENIIKEVKKYMKDNIRVKLNEEFGETMQYKTIYEKLDKEK